MNELAASLVEPIRHMLAKCHEQGVHTPEGMAGILSKEVAAQITSRDTADA